MTGWIGEKKKKKRIKLVRFSELNNKVKDLSIFHSSRSKNSHFWLSITKEREGEEVKIRI